MTNATYGQQNTRKKSGLWWKILLGIAVIVLLLALLAEFGLRWFIKDNLESSLKEEAAASKVQMQSDPTVALGSHSVLLGMLQGKIPQLDMTIPSSLQVSYKNNDKSKPVVSGNPAVTMHATDIKVNGSSKEDMIMGSLDVETVMPADAMLAQAQQSMSESKSTDNSDPMMGIVGDLLQVTDITANEQDQTLVFQLGGGVADLVMKPSVKDGQLQMDAEDVKLLGFSLPDSIVESLGQQLAQQAAEAGGKLGNMEMTDATVTSEGLKVVMHGSDVSMTDMAKSVEESGGTVQPGTGTGSGSAGTLDQNSGGDNTAPSGVYGSSGDAYGS